MRFRKNLIITLLICYCFVNPATAAQSSKQLFHIPEYPGTEVSKEYSNTAEFERPMATIVRVYKTVDGSALDKQQVLAFYKDHMEGKGWKADASSNSGENSLRLRCNLSETLDDKTYIRVDGAFCLWVAPKDGTYTILLKHGRSSGADQATITKNNALINSLDYIGPRLNYDVIEAHAEIPWPDDYENEYLINRRVFTLYANDRPTGPHGDSSSRISITVLTYRDANIAEEAGKEHTFQLVGGSKDLGNNRRLYSLPFGFNMVLVKDKTVVLIQDQSRRQEEVVKKIAAKIEKLL